MASSAEGPNDGEVATLIREEAHRSAFGSLPGSRRSHEDRFLVGNSIGRVTDGSLDVRTGQTGIGLKQVVLSRTFAQFAKDELDRDTSPAYDRFAHHHLWVDLNPIRDRHVKTLREWLGLQKSDRTPNGG